MLQEKSNLWKTLVAKMKEEGRYGLSLPLMCNNHRDYVVNATTSKDFAKLPEGIVC